MFKRFGAWFYRTVITAALLAAGIFVGVQVTGPGQYTVTNPFTERDTTFTDSLVAQAYSDSVGERYYWDVLCTRLADTSKIYVPVKIGDKASKSGFK